MSYPSLQEYNEAVQNPRTAFGDPDLQAGRVELNRLGLPFARSGGFASVYKIDCGASAFAVRCFKQEAADQQQRYRAISQHLNVVRLPYTVDFTFLEHGIRVKGCWYPVLKMAWVQGETLNTYIEKNLQDARVLLNLADRWVKMTDGLRRANIAHGDLQHGNVLVVGGDYRLIDYDGMYVPALNGYASNEVGLPSYQHPRRTAFDFGPGLDNFSAWVIYVSLVALSVDPQLWRKFQAGDDCLLFRKEDFDKPDRSGIFRVLERCSNQSLQLVVTQFKSFIYLAPLLVPPVSGSLAAGIVPASTGVSAGSDWLADHLPRPNTNRIAASAMSVSVPVADAGWIFDHKNIGLQGGLQLEFENSVIPERAVLAVSGCCLLALLFLLPSLSGARTAAVMVAAFWAVTFLLLNVSLWVWRFRSDPSYLALAELRDAVCKLSSQLSAKQGAIRAVEQEKKELLNRFIHQSQILENRLQECDRNEKEAVDAQWSRCAAVLASVRQRQQQADIQERTELKQLQDSCASLKRQITLLTSAEDDELKNTLLRRQTDHLNAWLQSAKLGASSVADIGPRRTSKLASAGIHTAADVSLLRIKRIRGFKTALASAIVAWRDKIEAQARATMPRSLPTQEVDRIRFRYAQQRCNLQVALEREQNRTAGEEEAISARCAAVRASLDREERDVTAKEAAHVQRIRAGYKPQTDKIRADLASLKARFASEVRNVDARMSQVHPEFARLTYERGKLKRELENATRLICFSSYLKRIIFIAR